MKDRKLLSICLIFLVAGFLAVHLGGSVFLKELRVSQAERYLNGGDRVRVTGQLYKREQTSDYQILYLKNNSIIQEDNQLKQSLKESRLIIYDKEQITAKPGNTVEAEGELSFFEPDRNPGNFDSRFYYQMQNIHARLWSRKISASGDVWKVRSCLWKLKERIKGTFEEAAGKEHASILSAMLLGDRAGMDGDVKELYQKSGIAHVIAISGLHLSFIGIGVYQFLRRITGSYLAGGFFGMLFLSAYILMIGLSVSALRALVMFVIRVGADMSGRAYDPLTALSVAAVTAVIWRPLSYYDGGFQLSFGTLLGILLFVPKGEGKKKGTRATAAAIVSGFFIHLTILPVLLFHYYEFPVYSVFLNIIVIPLMSVILFLALWGSAFFCICPAAGYVCVKICVWVLELYEGLCRLTSQMPCARIVCGRPDMWQIAVYYLVVTWLYILIRYKRNKHIYKRKYLVKYISMIAVVMYSFSLFILIQGNRVGQLRWMEVTMLDVGQGDSIFIRTPEGITCLMDGGSSDIKQIGKYRIEPFLKCRGVGKLDYVFVSHGDADHVNGIEEMIERQLLGVKIGCLVLPDESVWDEGLKNLAAQAEEKQIQVAVIKKGQKISGKRGMMLRCIQPGTDYSGETGNAASMVLDLSFGNFDMLLTGDVEGQGEKLLTEEIQKEYEVLKVAHHGSGNSTGEEFLKKTRSGIALISCGIHNRYGHPHEETIERLKKEGCIIYSTSGAGAVTVKTNGEKMTLANHCVFHYNSSYEKFK